MLPEEIKYVFFSVSETSLKIQKWSGRVRTVERHEGDPRDKVGEAGDSRNWCVRAGQAVGNAVDPTRRESNADRLGSDKSSERRGPPEGTGVVVLDVWWRRYDWRVCDG